MWKSNAMIMIVTTSNKMNVNMVILSLSIVCGWHLSAADGRARAGGRVVRGARKSLMSGIEIVLDIGIRINNTANKRQQGSGAMQRGARYPRH